MAAPHYTRFGFGALKPYLYVDLATVQFVREVFDAKVLLPEDYDGGPAHIEVEIDGCILILEAMETAPPELKGTGTVYLHVPDVDAVYEKAMAAGASDINAPEDKPYGERGAGIKDPSGNTWWLATYIGGD